MNRHLHLDPTAGVSGAQLIALLLSLRASRERLVETVEAIAPGATVEIAEGLIGETRTLTVRLDDTEGERPAVEVRRALEDAALSDRARSRALASLAALVDAIARAGSTEREAVDLPRGWLVSGTLAGCCVLLEDLEVTSLSCGPLVSSPPGAVAGGGPITEHQPKVVADLLEPFAVHVDDEETAELITPLGAALVAALAEPAHLHPGMRIERQAHGAGAEGGHGVSRLLRGSLGSLIGRMVELRALVTGEEAGQVSYALERLRDAGASECWSESVVLPEGRLGTVVTAIGELRRESELRAVIHRETAALSVHSALVESVEPRYARQAVSTPFGKVSVLRKADWLQPDLDGCAELAREGGVPLHRVLEAAKHAARRADPRAAEGPTEGGGQAR